MPWEPLQRVPGATFSLIRKPHVVVVSEKMPGEVVSPLTHQHSRERYDMILNLNRSRKVNSQNVSEHIC